nr:uncharacterized protein LOC123763064 [Procambarus clarkii]
MREREAALKKEQQEREVALKERKMALKKKETALLQERERMDHQAIIPLFRDKNPIGKFPRWSLTIQEFLPTFGYLPGKHNVVADALSRYVAPVHVEYLSLDLRDVELAQRQDPMWAPIISFLMDPHTTLTVKPPVPLKELVLLDHVLHRKVMLGSPARLVHQLVIPVSIVPTVLKLVHDAPHSAHPGKDRTIKQARLTYYWPKMAKQIERHVDHCLTCLAHGGHVAGPNPSQTYPTTNAPWDRVSMDLLTNFAETSRGNKHLLVMVDNFSRYCELVPIPNKTAETIASAFHDHIICSNGLAERTNKKVLDALRVTVNRDSHKLDELNANRPMFYKLLCQLLHRRHTPHFVLFGTDMRFPNAIISSLPAPLYNYDDYVKVKRRDTQLVFQRVKEPLSKASDEFTRLQNTHAKPTRIRPGPLVMILNQRRDGPMYKLTEKFLGLYRVLEHIKVISTSWKT